ncbi:MAG: cobalamin biosynthesis protein CbiD [Firmicutes bacterium]|nr:cobalamin biosynthesis protein CbiD [Bacillota bacterium]
MEGFVVKDGKKLRLGYTTGSCASAASKAAAIALLTGKGPEIITITTPKGKKLDLKIEDMKICEGRASCAVRKDSGDDPDVTDGALIYSEVALCPEPGVHIDGGKGVGRVTKRGLDQPVGNAAINSGPRRQIEENLKEVLEASDYQGGLSVVISVPNGEELARKTFNPRLGIIGGISILGTTGIVDPMSEQALIDTIRISLRQKKESGAGFALLTPGNMGADYIKGSLELDPALSVAVSNYIGDSLDMCKEMGFEGALIVGHIGKLVKLAGGLMNTHSKYGDCRMEILAAYGGAEGLSKEAMTQILDCATCDDALRILSEEGLLERTMKRLAARIAFIIDYRVKGAIKTDAMVYSNEYGLLCETDGARQMLETIAKEHVI